MPRSYIHQFGVRCLYGSKFGGKLAKSPSGCKDPVGILLVPCRFIFCFRMDQNSYPKPSINNFDLLPFSACVDLWECSFSLRCQTHCIMFCFSFSFCSDASDLTRIKHAVDEEIAVIDAEIKVRSDQTNSSHTSESWGIRERDIGPTTLRVKWNLSLLQSGAYQNPPHQNYSYLDTDKL